MGYQIGFDSTVPSDSRKLILAILNDSRSWNIPVDSVGLPYADVMVSLCSTDDIKVQFPTWGEPHLSMTVFFAKATPRIIFNRDNWRSVPDAARAIGHTLKSYRTYLVNHEFGHFLSLGHAKDTKGPCPVMYQQTKGGLCDASPWPSEAEKRRSRSTS